MKGIVLKSTGLWYTIKSSEDNILYNCRLRGKIRLQNLKSSNPIAVGDKIIFKIENETGIIESIEPRKNYLIRQSIKNKNHNHIIAANIDQLLVIATLNSPKTSIGFIDRLLVSAESFRIPQIIIFNKIDLLNNNELIKLEDLINVYQSIGIGCIKTSTHSGVGIKSLTEKLIGKITLASGHSGVGKSSIINAIIPNIDIKTSSISTFSQKGTHTTTFSQMYEATKNISIIDTPGIKEFGLADVKDSEITDYFPEMRGLHEDCKFNNCLHVNEPKCAIIEAVKNGTIAYSRYKSYLSILENHDNRN